MYTARGEDAQRAAAVNLQLNPHSGGANMLTATTRSQESTAQPRVPTTSAVMPTLYLSLELGSDVEAGVHDGSRPAAAGARHRAARRSSGWTARSRGRSGGSAAGRGAGGELLRGRARWVLAASRAGRARDRQSRRRFVEHRGESAGAAREGGSARTRRSWC